MDIQTYFEDIQPEIVNELQAAQQSIYAAVAWFTDQELFEILCEKACQKIHVSILVLNDEVNTGGFGLDFERLKKAGGSIHQIGCQLEMMHNKFCVIDKKTVITGSYDWTHKAKSNDENITITKDSPELATDFIAEFNRLYKKYLGETSEATDLHNLLKRLEIVRNTIVLEDADDIHCQTAKLKSILPDVAQGQSETLTCIINHIEDKKYGEAVRLIVDFLEHYQSLITWTDPEIRGLQLEIRSLSLQISSLEDKLADIDQIIHHFEVRHAEELGDIVLKILHIKKKLAQQKAQDEIENTGAREGYEAAEKDEQQYQETFEEAKKNPIQPLNQDEEKELKTVFRKLSKLTHPDIVDKQFEKEAAELFVKAKEAKDSNDLNALHEILNYLETGKPFKMKFETITRAEELRTEAGRLRHTVESLLQKIRAIKESEAYQTIFGIVDWDTYFAGTKEKLQTELERLNTLEYA